MICPFTGRTGRSPNCPLHAPAATTTRPAGSAARSPGATRAWRSSPPACSTASARAAAGRPRPPARGRARVGGRGDGAPGVAGAVARHVEREPHGGRQRRLGAARLARAQALALEAQLATEREETIELGGLVRVARDRERAGAAQPRVAPRRLR